MPTGKSIGAVGVRWQWVRQGPGGGKCRGDLSHSLSQTCSWVFCEISAVTRESQEKLGGKKGSGKAQEVAASYGCINSPCAPGEVPDGRCVSLR